MIKEACVETIEEALLAQKNGAHRIELCSDLANDGLTPSYELMQTACALLDIPVMVMARPRPGNFIFTPEELKQTKIDIDNAKKAGAMGVVIGLLTADGEIDKKNTRALADYAYPLQVTFHKAIDELKYPLAGVKVLKTIKGITRILTSGGKATAFEGQKTIREMIKTSQNILTILVAGKVTYENVSEIQELTGANEFHGRKIAGDLSARK
jgi:copper homeostasis protein